MRRDDHRLAEWTSAPNEECDEIRRRMEAWNRGDVEPWVAGFATDCQWYPTTEGGLVGESAPIRGHEGLRSFAFDAHELWEQFRIEVDDVLRRGRWRLLAGRWRARGRSSGIDIETPMFWLTETNETGKAIWARSFVDLDAALVAAAEREATSEGLPRG